jgi:hypothetical protein
LLVIRPYVEYSTGLIKCWRHTDGSSPQLRLEPLDGLPRVSIYRVELAVIGPDIDSVARLVNDWSCAYGAALGRIGVGGEDPLGSSRLLSADQWDRVEIPVIRPKVDRVFRKIYHRGGADGTAIRHPKDEL